MSRVLVRCLCGQKAWAKRGVTLPWFCTAQCRAAGVDMIAILDQWLKEQRP